MTETEKKNLQNIMNKRLHDDPDFFIPTKKEKKEFQIIKDKMKDCTKDILYYGQALYEIELVQNLMKKFNIKSNKDKLRLAMKFVLWSRENYRRDND